MSKTAELRYEQTGVCVLHASARPGGTFRAQSLSTPSAAGCLLPCIAQCMYLLWHCRPGRLDKLLYVSLPGPEARVAILRTQTMRTPLAPDVDLQSIGQSPRVQGFSGADLAALAREAAVLSLKVHSTHTNTDYAFCRCSSLHLLARFAWCHSAAITERHSLV